VYIIRRGSPRIPISRPRRITSGRPRFVIHRSLSRECYRRSRSISPRPRKILVIGSGPPSPSHSAKDEYPKREASDEKDIKPIISSNEKPDEKVPDLIVDNLDQLVNMRNDFGNGAMHFFQQTVEKVKELFQKDHEKLHNEIHSLRMQNMQLEQQLNSMKKDEEDDKEVLKKEIMNLKEKIKAEECEKEKVTRELTNAQSEIRHMKDKLEKFRPESYWRLEIGRMENAYVKEIKEMEIRYKNEIRKLKNSLNPEMENKQVQQSSTLPE